MRIDFLGHQNLAAERLRQILQAGRDIDRIADHRELRMALVPDVARDDEAGVDADAEANRVVQSVRQGEVQSVDIGGDGRACGDRLPASDPGGSLRPNNARSPSPRTWLGSPPAAITALLTALRNWLMMNTVS